jgi:hypothetical protein
MMTTLEHKGFRIEVTPVGTGWRASIFQPGANCALADSPSNLEKSSKEEIVAEAKQIVDASIAWKAGIHRKALAYWLERSKAGDEGYDVEWQGVTERFHGHCESAIEEAHERLHEIMRQRAMDSIERGLKMMPTAPKVLMCSGQITEQKPADALVTLSRARAMHDEGVPFRKL